MTPSRSILATALKALDLAAVAALVIAVYMIGARANDPGGSRAQKGTAPARTPPQMTGDRDGDGIKDRSDLAPAVPAPENEGENGGESDAATTFAAPELPPRDDCRRKAISLRRGEGACYLPDGGRMKVVSRSRQLGLEEIGVAYRDVQLRRRLGPGRTAPRADGVYVVVELEIVNRRDGPVDFDVEQVGLLVGTRFKTPERFAAQETRHSLKRLGGDLQPGASVTGVVVFDVNKRFARRLDESGYLRITQFSEAQPLRRPSHTVGFIRLYR